MKLKIITLPFDKKLNGFDSELVEEFILNKKVLNVEYKFFVTDKPYWTFVIQYEAIVKEKSKKEKVDEFNLTEVEKKLFEELRNWRNERASDEGFPPYIIASNNQVKEIAKLKPESLAKLKTIQGIGTKKIKDYGEKILEIVKQFCGDKDE